MCVLFYTQLLWARRKTSTTVISETKRAIHVRERPHVYPLHLKVRPNHNARAYVVNLAKNCCPQSTSEGHFALAASQKLAIFNDKKLLSNFWLAIFPPQAKVCALML